MSKSKAKNSSNKSKRKEKVSPHIVSAKILFFVGVMFLFIYLIYHVHSLAVLSFFNNPIPVPPLMHTRASKPKQIIIDRINVDLPIYETKIDNNIWEIAENGASHLDNSARPEENGTLILYAHNTSDRFGPLLWTKKGDEIKIKTLDNKNYSYVVTDLQTVDPNNTQILSSQKGKTLILYTCTGFADLKRHVIIAKPLR